MNNDLRLIVMDNISELGDKVKKHLNDMNNNNEDYIIKIINDRFNNGEGKVTIKGSVREKDLYIISDVGNYSITYKLHGHDTYMSPDEHFQDIKRVISATSGHAYKITVIMPLLYQSRQHKRKGRESLDCALALQELERLGVNNIITVDAHDPNIVNAIPNIAFDNFYPTSFILDDLLEEMDDDNLIVISPDIGAMERARYYADKLKCDVGLFYKRRDLTKVINGKNPIVEHAYMGSSIDGRDAIVVDDMISSGASMLEVAKLLKEKGAKNVYLVSSFVLFTEGVECFAKAYKEGHFVKLFTTNLSFVPENIKKEPWYHEVDLSILIAQIINTLNKKESLEKYFYGGVL